MIYELRIYTVKQGTLADVIKAASTVSRDIRKDDYGKLEGYWSTEIGPLNQVMHLWSYHGSQRADAAARRAHQEPALGRRVRAADPAAPVRQDIRLLERGASAGGARRARPTSTSSATIAPAGRRAAMGEAVHRRAQRAREVFEDRRAMGDGGAASQRGLPHLGLSGPQHPGVQCAPPLEGPRMAGVPEGGTGLLDEMHSTIMLPAPHSPLK